VSRDVRDLALKRVFTILGTLGFVTTWRNRADIEPLNPETKQPQLPAAVLLDWKENRRVSTRGKALGTQFPPTLMDLTPEIWVVLMPKENQTNEEIDQEITTWRRNIVVAIRDDDSLIALLGNSGEIEYLGMETDMQSGGPMEGSIRFDFSFSYMFDPDDL